MKKIFIIIVSLIILLAAWRERFVLEKFFNEKVLGIINSIQQSPLATSALESADALAGRVFTGGALRSSENASNAFLTGSGVLEWTNKNRSQFGAAALVPNPQLDNAAKAKLKDMFAQQYFEHISPQGKGPADLARAAGYNYIIIGENLALGNFKDDESLVTAWMNSPGHRANILNKKYTKIGIAVGQGVYEGRNVWMAVQEFGRPMNDCPAIDKNLKIRIDLLSKDLAEAESALNQKKRELESLSPQSREEYEAYNLEVKKYNDLVHIYNNRLDEAKQLTAQYNSQIKIFNACAQ